MPWSWTERIICACTILFAILALCGLSYIRGVDFGEKLCLETKSKIRQHNEFSYRLDKPEKIVEKDELTYLAFIDDQKCVSACPKTDPNVPCYNCCGKER